MEICCASCSGPIGVEPELPVRTLRIPKTPDIFSLKVPLPESSDPSTNVERVLETVMFREGSTGSTTDPEGVALGVGIGAGAETTGGRLGEESIEAAPVTEAKALERLFVREGVERVGGAEEVVVADELEEVVVVVEDDELEEVDELEPPSGCLPLR